MTEVRHVFTYLGPNEVAEGFYTYDGAMVTMVFANGEPVKLDQSAVTEQAAPAHVEAAAKRLTKRIRKALLGDFVPGFEKGRRLDYRKERFA